MTMLPLLSGLLCLTVTIGATIIPAHAEGNASWPYHKYKTVSFTPPLINVTRHSKALTDEAHLFVAPDGGTPYQIAPIIATADGEIVWNGPLQHAFNFGYQQYLGQPVLVAWNGTIQPEPVGRGYGEIFIWNKHYEVLRRTTLSGNYLTTVPNHPQTFPSNIDLHEANITPHGTILVTANNVTTADLTSVGGPKNGWAISGQIHEIDIATNEVLFSWDSLEHLDDLPFTASIYPLGTEGFTGTNASSAWGYFHINAVAPYDDGYIISSRYLCSAIAIGRDGNVKWRIGGRREGDFSLGAGADFCFQHDIRAVLPGTADAYVGAQSQFELHMHDNHNAPLEYLKNPTSAKTLSVDLDAMHVELVQQYINATGPTYATAQGSMQVLPESKNVIVGHGWIPVVEEFSHKGEILSTIQVGEAESRPGGGYLSALGRPSLCYRAFKHEWTGCPKSAPDVVAEKVQPTSGHGRWGWGKGWGKGRGREATIKVYVSWNGATEVEGWEVYAGPSPYALKHVKSAPKIGFETEIDFSSWSAEYVQVKPKMKNGKDCECDAVDSKVVKVICD